MAWGYVQSNNAASAVSANSIGAAFTTANITAANSVVVVASVNGTTTSSVTDTAGNAYVKLGAVTAGVDEVSVWYAPITAGGGTKPTVTAHFAANSTDLGIAFAEYSGLSQLTGSSAVDTSSSAINTSTNAPTSGTTGATTAANEAVIGFYGDFGNSLTVSGSGGSTVRTQLDNSASGIAIEDKDSGSSGGTQSSTFSLSATPASSGAFCYVFKLGAGGGGAGPVPPPALGLDITLAVPGAPTTGTFGVGDTSTDSLGHVWICTVAGTPGTWIEDPVLGAALVSASGAINTTETYISPSFPIPANTLQVGTTYRITVAGTCTSTVGNVSTFTLRLGTAGTTADTSVCTVTCTGATTGTSVPFMAEFFVTIRSIGSGGTAMGAGKVVNSGTTGISSNGVGGGGSTATSAVNTTVQNFLGVSYKTALATTTSTFQIGVVECVKA
jgi:hypothetical protein